MSQLSAQSIRKLCVDLGFNTQRWHIDPDGQPRPMIFPFLGERVVINGASAGLSAASYDIRIAHELTLSPHPAYVIRKAIMNSHHGDMASHIMNMIRDGLLTTQGAPTFTLAHSLEDFALPPNVAGYVCDKSTYARRGVSAFNTLFDPGFRGCATLELVNFSEHEVFIKVGDPIAQIVFHWLDEPTDRPYQGKYQDQPRRAQEALYELLPC